MIEKAYDFKKKLLTVHKCDICIDSETPRDDIFVFQDGFKIFTEEKDAVIQKACDDFIDFLKVSAHINADYADEKTVSNSLYLSIGSTDELGEYATYKGYKIDIKPENIHICAFDGRGAQQALFRLEDMMSAEKKHILKTGTIKNKPMFSPQMVHSAYGVDEYPDEYLSLIAHEGRDAILVFTKGVNECETGPLDFNDLIKRAASYGIDVYAYSYMKSPVSPHDADAEKYYNSTYGNLFKECPDLKGVILVGESIEFPSNDPHVSKQSRIYNKTDGIPNEKPSSGWYPCEDYPLWLDILKRVIRKHSPSADIVFWTYNWCYQNEEARIKLIESLPTDISLLVTFELPEPIKYKNSVGKCADYTLSFAGPGKCFTSEAIAAKKRNLRLYSMTNTGGRTWDFGVVPYEPMPNQWIKRYEAMKKAKEDWGLCGIMECHHYGFYPSFISKLSKYAFSEPYVNYNTLLDNILSSEFGEFNLKATRKALSYFSDAITYYTPSAADQYGPFRTGPSYPFCLSQAINIPLSENDSRGSGICEAVYRNACEINITPTSIRIYDEIHSLNKMYSLMQKGIKLLESIKEPCEKLLSLINLARFIERCVITTIHAKKWHILKCKLSVQKTKRGFNSCLSEMEKLLEKEKENTLSAIPLVEADSSIGYEPTMGYMADKWHLEWKLRHMEYVLKQDIKKYRENLHL